MLRNAGKFAQVIKLCGRDADFHEHVHGKSHYVLV